MGDREEKFYLEYAISNGEHFMLAFDDQNNRDGCHISLDMYKVQLGPVDHEVMTRILHKFKGEIVTSL